jgi:hypothetical protein
MTIWDGIIMLILLGVITAVALYIARRENDK